MFTITQYHDDEGAPAGVVLAGSIDSAAYSRRFRFKGSSPEAAQAQAMQTGNMINKLASLTDDLMSNDGTAKIHHAGCRIICRAGPYGAFLYADDATVFPSRPVIKIASAYSIQEFALPARPITLDKGYEQYLAIIRHIRKPGSRVTGARLDMPSIPNLCQSKFAEFMEAALDRYVALAAEAGAQARGWVNADGTISITHSKESFASCS